MTAQAQPETPEIAQTSIAAHKADPVWIKGYLDGDQAKHAEMTRLHSIAFPERQAEAPAPAKPAEQQPAAAAKPEENVEATAPIAEPPSGPWEYELAVVTGATATEADHAEMTSIAQALFEAKVPPFAVNFVQAVGLRNVKGNDGKPFSDEQLQAMDRQCRAELDRRHGPEHAKAMLADARKVLKRLGDHERVEFYLNETGAGSDPDAIETLARVERDYYAKRGA